MKLKFSLVVVTFVVLIFQGCNQNIPEDFNYGTVENNVYKNNYFGYSAKIPDGWDIQTAEENEMLSDEGSKITAGDDEHLEKELETAKSKTAILLTVFKYELGSIVTFNPSVVIMIENVRGNFHISNSSDYLDASRKFMEKSNMPYTHIDDKYNEINIGGEKFYQMNTTMNIDEINIYQTYYSLYINSYCFTVIISYVDESQRKESENIVRDMKFE